MLNDEARQRRDGARVRARERNIPGARPARTPRTMRRRALEAVAFTPRSRVVGQTRRAVCRAFVGSGAATRSFLSWLTHLDVLARERSLHRMTRAHRDALARSDRRLSPRRARASRAPIPRLRCERRARVSRGGRRRGRGAEGARRGGCRLGGFGRRGAKGRARVQGLLLVLPQAQEGAARDEGRRPGRGEVRGGRRERRRRRRAQGGSAHASRRGHRELRPGGADARRHRVGPLADGPDRQLRRPRRHRPRARRHQPRAARGGDAKGGVGAPAASQHQANGDAGRLRRRRVHRRRRDGTRRPRRGRRRAGPPRRHRGTIPADPGAPRPRRLPRGARLRDQRGGDRGGGAAGQGAALVGRSLRV